MANKDRIVITIRKIGGTDNKYWIQDTNEEFYSGFKEWEGEMNKDYLELLNGNHGEPFNEGDNVLIEFTKSVGKDDKIYKNIKGIYPADGEKPTQPTSISFPSQTPRSVANTGSQSKGNDDFGKRLAVHGFVNALISSGTKPNDITGEIIIELTKLESRIDAILNPSAFRQAVQAHAPQVVEPELPTIQVAPDIAEYAQQIENEEINVEDIPFN